MRVWIICVGEPIPTDPGTPRLLRAGILAHVLANRGHEVVWWNSTVDHYQKKLRAKQSIVVSFKKNYKIWLLHGGIYRKNISLARLVNHKRIAREFRRLARTEKRPDVILAAMPTIELAYEAIRFGKDHGVPVVIDIRDLWPDIFSDVFPEAVRFLAKLLFVPWELALQKMLKGATALIAPSEPFLNWGISRARRRRTDLDRVFHLASDPSVASKMAEETREGDSSRHFWSEIEREIALLEKSPIFGCFAGALSTRQDLLTILSAASRLPTEFRNSLRIIVCGRGDLDHKIIDITNKSDVIYYTGWIGANELRKIYSRCHFAILPANPTLDYLGHYPNKLGEYLSAGLPVMTPLRGITRELLEKYQIGYFYQSGNVKDAMECLIRIIKESRDILDKHKRARLVFKEFFDPNKIYDEFSSYIENFQGTVRCRVDKMVDA